MYEYIYYQFWTSRFLNQISFREVAKLRRQKKINFGTFETSKNFVKTNLEKIKLAVREANVSRHNVGPIEGPPRDPRYHTAVGMYEGIQGALIRPP